MSIINFVPPDRKRNLEQKMTFETFYNKYSQEVYRYLLGKIGQKEIAEDIASESFLYCYEHYESYDPQKSAVSTWLYLVVNSRLKNYYRGRKETVEWSELEDYLFDDQPDLDRSIYLEELRDVLATCINSLSEVQQQVIVKRFFQHREFDEIATELGISSGNVRVIQSRALAKLRKDCSAKGLSLELE